MTTFPPVDPVELSVHDARLTVQFHWTGDRFVHQVLLDGDTCLTSVDGDGLDEFPPSPPIQQLSAETVNERHVIFGVGAAGQGHWSLSVEAIAGDSGQFPAIRFDWACRTKKPRPALSTCYRSAGSVDGLLIAPESNTKSETNRDQQLRLSPIASGDGPTWQWAYRISVAGDADV